MRLSKRRDAELEKLPGFHSIESEIECITNITYKADYSIVKEAYDNLFTEYAWPGGYPIIFVLEDSTVLCAKCARKVFILENEIVTMDIHYEGGSVFCEDCNKEIESAHGEVES